MQTPLTGRESPKPAVPASSENSVRRLHLHGFSEPDGNLYRGWAVGVENWNANLFILTVLVILCQILGPLFSLIWARNQLRTGTLWYVWNPRANWVFETDVMTKILGTILLLIIFMNARNILKRRDLQADRLRQLYGDRLNIAWMHVDAFCTAWCVTVCCIAVVPILWVEQDVKGVILDAFGCLFMTNLHEYSGGMEYGIDEAEFDQIIHDHIGDSSQIRRKIVWSREGIDSHWVRREIDIDSEARIKRYHWYTTAFLYGDFYYAIGHLVTSIVFCFGATQFNYVKFVYHEDGHINHGWLIKGVLHPHGICLGAVMFVMLLGYRAFFHFTDSSRRPDYVSCVYRVLFERPDPRQVNKALAVSECNLRMLDMELATSR